MLESATYAVEPEISISSARSGVSSVPMTAGSVGSDTSTILSPE